LFGNKLLRRTLLATFLMVAVNVNVYTFTAWLPTILLERTNAMGRSLLITWVIQLGALPGALVGSWASERFGRKESIVALSLAAAALTFIFGFARNAVTLATEGFLLSVFVYSLVAITFAVYVPELFPTSVRMTGASLANACGRGANIIVPQVVAWMLPHGGSVTVFVFLSVLLVTQAVVIWILGVDTRFRSLEQI
jgi:putative MFS transporter